MYYAPQWNYVQQTQNSLHFSCKSSSTAWVQYRITTRELLEHVRGRELSCNTALYVPWTVAVCNSEIKTSRDNTLEFVKLAKNYYIHRKLPCEPKFPIGPISSFPFHSFVWWSHGNEVMSATHVCWYRPVEVRQKEPTVFRPSGHWQMMSPANIVHVPPFWQGFSSHSSNTAWVITIYISFT